MGNAGQLILLRHGQSMANASGIFTGVLDSPLSALGVHEAEMAASLLSNAGLTAGLAFTSELSRSRKTAAILTAAMPGYRVQRDWRLNERNYGALTGRSKAGVLREFGPEWFLNWRRSVDTAPPPMPESLHAQLAASNLFRSLPPQALTRTESLRDVIDRVDAFYAERVVGPVTDGVNVLLVAHGNTLRATCGILDDLDGDQLRLLNIPTGQPLIYRFDGALRPVIAGGEYLDESRAAAAALALAYEGGT